MASRATLRACRRRGSAERVGGDQIDYVDEKPEVRRMFAEANWPSMALRSRMDDVYAAELPTLPPKAA